MGAVFSFFKLLLCIAVVYVNTYYLLGYYDIVMPISWLNISNYGVSIVYYLAFAMFVIDIVMGNVLQNVTVYLRIIYNFIVTGVYSLMFMIVYYSQKLTINGLDSVYFKVRWLKFGIEKKWSDSELIAMYDEVYYRFKKDYKLDMYVSTVQDDFCRLFEDNKLYLINTGLHRKASLIKEAFYPQLEYLFNIFKKNGFLKLKDVTNLEAGFMSSCINFLYDHKIEIFVGVSIAILGGAILYYYFNHNNNNIISEIDIDTKSVAQLDSSKIRGFVDSFYFKDSLSFYRMPGIKNTEKMQDLLAEYWAGYKLSSKEVVAVVRYYLMQINNFYYDSDRVEHYNVKNIIPSFYLFFSKGNNAEIFFKNSLESDRYLFRKLVGYSTYHGFMYDQQQYYFWLNLIKKAMLRDNINPQPVVDYIAHEVANLPVNVTHNIPENSFRNMENYIAEFAADYVKF